MIRWIGIAVGVLILCFTASQQMDAAEALAFLTEAGEKVQIQKAGGESVEGTVGDQLFAGDTVTSTEGTASLVYLSGRSVRVKEGTSHKVEKGKGSPPGMKRLMDTLGEMMAESDDEDRPVVHGMARNLPLPGAEPANTRLRGTDFRFSWNGLEGSEGYVFTLENEAGEVLDTRTVTDTFVVASDLALEPGGRYAWGAEAQFLIPHTTGKKWFELAAASEADSVNAALAEIESTYEGTARSLLKAAALYKSGFLYESTSILAEVKGRKDLASVNRMLRMIQMRMDQSNPVK